VFTVVKERGGNNLVRSDYAKPSEARPRLAEVPGGLVLTGECCGLSKGHSCLISFHTPPPGVTTQPQQNENVKIGKRSQQLNYRMDSRRNTIEYFKYFTILYGFDLHPVQPEVSQASF